MPADSNPYESPGVAAPLDTQPLPWAVGIRTVGGLLIAAAVFASLFWTVGVGVIRDYFPANGGELPDYFPATALFAYLVGSWAIAYLMRPLLRIGAAGLVCGLGHGFTIALIVLYIPPPSGGVNLLRGVEGAIVGFVLFGMFGAAIGLVITAAKEFVWHVGQWLLRKVRGT